MAENYIETLREPIEAIERALTQPETWADMTPTSVDEAKRVLDAAASKDRELRRLIAQAEAVVSEAEREANLARARRAEYEEQRRLLEENLVRPLLEGFGTGKTHQLDTGWARVAICKKPARLVLSAAGRELGEANVVAMLPREYVRVLPPEPNKKAIKEAMEKDGVVVPGFELEITGTRIDWRG